MPPQEATRITVVVLFLPARNIANGVSGVAFRGCYAWEFLEFSLTKNLILLYLSNIECAVVFIKATNPRKTKGKIVLFIMTALLF